MNQNLRARTSATEQARQEKPTQTQQQKGAAPFIHSPELKWLIIIGLLLTTAAGTYRSFSLYSRANPGQPIHQITTVPSSSFLSTQTIDLKSLPYFAQKSNFFNQKFVKLGWAWTSFVVWFHSIALASFYFGSRTDQQSPSNNQLPRSNTSKHPSTHVPRIISLHLIASVLWIFLTQWFFGSSLIERILILSGAKCVPSPNLQSAIKQSHVLESIYCEQRWGKKIPGLDPVTLSTYRPYWSGGVDVSGHTFLLSFSIMIILSALQPSLVHLFKREVATTEEIPTSYKVAIYVNLGLLFLWWWMLLMTSLYFHGPTEKLLGLALGLGSWFFVEYFVDKLLA